MCANKNIIRLEKIKRLKTDKSKGRAFYAIKYGISKSSIQNIVKMRHKNMPSWELSGQYDISIVMVENLLNDKKCLKAFRPKKNKIKRFYDKMSLGLKQYYILLDSEQRQKDYKRRVRFEQYKDKIENDSRSK